jgi:hypothetical protein
MDYQKVEEFNSISITRRKTEPKSLPRDAVDAER